MYGRWSSKTRAKGDERGACPGSRGRSWSWHGCYWLVPAVSAGEPFGVPAGPPFELGNCTLWETPLCLEAGGAVASLTVAVSEQPTPEEGVACRMTRGIAGLRARGEGEGEGRNEGRRRGHATQEGPKRSSWQGSVTAA
ncbi:hypothetical protein L1887_58360 [Cichorium endivia]|nr:hypothetical protein L1887_58360 [Cichorium endivia]